MELFDRVEGKPQLLISQEYDNQRLMMIDLYKNDSDQIRFQINKANVINQGLSVDPDIILLGGTEIDVAKLYRQSQESLRSIEKRLLNLESLNDRLEGQINESQVIVASLEQTIAKQKEKLSVTDKELSDTVTRIKQQTLIVASQTEEIADQQRKIQSDRQSLARFKSEIESQRLQISHQQAEYDALLSETVRQKKAIKRRADDLQVQALEISKREAILDQLESRIAGLDGKIMLQESQIADQLQVLQQQTEQIETQTTSIYMMALIIALIVSLAAIIYQSRRKYQALSIELKQAKEEADYANRSKSMFLANMSHELRTPLNAVMGFSEILLKDQNITAEQGKVLGIINHSGDHLLNLINDVLDLSKIEAGKTPIDNTAFDLGALIDDTLSLMEDRAMAKGLSLVLHKSDSLPSYIWLDSAKLRQILLNYLSNAIKYSEQGEIKVSLDFDGKYLKLSVQDNGIGISKEDLVKVFDPFVQVGSASAKTGTGLGLAITRQFVELLGGQVGVESRLDHGSCFIATLCCSPAEEEDVVGGLDLEPVREIVGLAPENQDLKVLIVDDQPDNMLLLKNILEVLGVHVREAINGAEAVALFEQWQPDFIWMDRRMPVMDGEAATRKIRSMSGGDKVVISALTASAFTDDKKAIVACGMDDFVAKPYRASSIYLCMGQHLQLNYIYADEPEPGWLDQDSYSQDQIGEALAGLDEKLLRQLYSATLLLDDSAIEPVLKLIEERDVLLVNSLRRIIADFHYHIILKALENVLEGEMLEGENIE